MGCIAKNERFTSEILAPEIAGTESRLSGSTQVEFSLRMPTLTRAEQAAELTKAKAAEENWNSRKAAASLGENAGKNAGKGAASSAGKAGAAAKAKTKKRMSDEPAAADEEPAGSKYQTGAKKAKTGQDGLLADINGEADDWSVSGSDDETMEGEEVQEPSRVIVVTKRIPTGNEPTAIMFGGKRYMVANPKGLTRNTFVNPEDSGDDGVLVLQTNEVLSQMYRDKGISTIPLPELAVGAWLSAADLTKLSKNTKQIVIAVAQDGDMGKDEEREVLALMAGGTKVPERRRRSAPSPFTDEATSVRRKATSRSRRWPRRSRRRASCGRCGRVRTARGRPRWTCGTRTRAGTTAP